MTLSQPVSPLVAPDRLVFVGGLHRSGTTALGRLLGDHPEISGLQGTGVREDEGQHLQTMYQPAVAYGGPGRFAHDPAAQLGPVTDAGEQARIGEGLIRSWMPYWDLESPLLLEKSPPNLVMGRFLQSVFPGSALVVIFRHPVVVALSSKKWQRGTSLSSLVEHWFVAHDALLRDVADLERVHVLRYEDLVADTDAALAPLTSFLGLSFPLVNSGQVRSTYSDRYRSAWSAMSGPLSGRERRRIVSRFDDAARRYGYDIEDVDARHDWSLPAP
ncbi:sulfotransferase family protein [Serinicoccus kebangsaanensis]|uniref:sulfotransferase family protein n=1 Tax=Serinicoccus kebangsaanensis TaxID=2602069 RepID=UPI00124E5062|nr:sulfotransferase [Serinicoccus kebangsaanensis]